MATKQNMPEELCADLWDLIVRKLHYSDAIRFSSVCTSWRRIAKSSGVFSRPVLLTVLGNRTSDSDVCASNRLSFRVRNLSDRNLSTSDVVNVAVSSLTERYCDSSCIGSSKGTLVLHHKKKENGIIIIDPFSGASFRVPPLVSLPFRSNNNNNRPYPEEAFYVYIWKAVILVPSDKNNRADQPNLVLVVSCGCSSNVSIAYYQNGSWETLVVGKICMDMVARERRLFLLYFECSFVEIWDFDHNTSNRPIKAITFKPFLRLPAVISEPKRHGRFYLVESMEELLLVRRLMLSGVTVGFQVYKSSLRDSAKWEKVESLRGERTLFVGGNESVSVSSHDMPGGCEENSIYFTDDRVMEWFNRGRGVGVYSLKHRKIKAFHMHDDNREVDQPAIWMFRIIK